MSTWTMGTVNWRFSLGLIVTWRQKSGWWKHTSLPSSLDNLQTPAPAQSRAGARHGTAVAEAGIATDGVQVQLCLLMLPSPGTHSPHRQTLPSCLETAGRIRCLHLGPANGPALVHKSAIASWGTALCADAQGHVPCCWHCCGTVAASKGWRRVQDLSPLPQLHQPHAPCQHAHTLHTRVTAVWNLFRKQEQSRKRLYSNPAE